MPCWDRGPGIGASVDHRCAAGSKTHRPSRSTPSARISPPDRYRRPSSAANPKWSRGSGSGGSADHVPVAVSNASNVVRRRAGVVDAARDVDHAIDRRRALLDPRGGHGRTGRPPWSAGDDEGRAGVSTAVDADGAATDVDGVATDDAGGVEAWPRTPPGRPQALQPRQPSGRRGTSRGITMRAYPQPAPACAVTARA